MRGPVWAIFKVTVAFSVSLFLVPIQALLVLFAQKWRYFFVLPRLWNRFASWMLGLRVTVVGQQSAARPLMIVGNHLSYLDIIALSAHSDGYFIAKHEVRSWPVFGWLAILRGTRFVRRDPKYVRGQRSALQDDFDRGSSLILFPEGTSTDGLEVKPFKSSLFEAVTSSTSKVTVQPFAIFFTHVDGQPIHDMFTRERVAWYSDLSLLTHLWWVLRRRSIHCRLEWLEPFEVAPGSHRKRVTHQAWEAVSSAVAKEYPPALVPRLRAVTQPGDPLPPPAQEAAE